MTGKVTGVDKFGRAVVDGKVYDTSTHTWIDGVVFDMNDYTIKSSASDKELAKIDVDSYKEVPEVFRKAILHCIDLLGAAGYDVEFRWKNDSKVATFAATVTKTEPPARGVSTSPLEAATLPRKETKSGDAPGFKTAEERDAAAGSARVPFNETAAETAARVKAARDAEAAATARR